MNSSTDFLSESHFAAIGKITVLSSNLEHTLVIFISRLIGSEEMTVAITAGSTAKGLLEILNAVYIVRIKDELFLDDMTSLISAIRKLEDRRNQIVHAYWQYDPVRKKARRTKIKRAKKSAYGIDVEDLDVGQLNEVAEVIALADRTLRALLRKLKLLGLLDF